MAKPAKDWETELIEHISMFVYDPLGFVYYAFGWGNDALKDEEGPDEWQKDILIELGKGTISIEEALMIAVRSGHGIGKTALIAWIILWFISTRPNPQIVVTANTKEQLLNKTWRELSKWHKLAINKHWFDWTATKFSKTDEKETWFAVATPWSKERSEAFAGTHEKYVLVIYDEASAIEDVIWEVTEGAMTTPGAIWVVFGNPTRNTGRFSECFKKYRHRWIRREIDSRTAKKANKKQIKQWIEDYGEDSDFVRVRVKGQEPRSGAMQFIGNDLVEAAMGKAIQKDSYSFAPRVLGVDPARFGDDQSVIVRRQGLKVFDNIEKHRSIDTMQFAGRVTAHIKEWKPHAVFVDAVGIGAGVIDRLIQLGHSDIVIEVNAGLPADENKKYFNKRAECWSKMKNWLKAGASIPDDNELRDDLTGTEYGYDAKNRVQLEKKEDMKARGLASPDSGDGISVTFFDVVNIEDTEDEDIDFGDIEQYPGYY